MVRDPQEEPRLTAEDIQNEVVLAMERIEKAMVYQRDAQKNLDMAQDKLVDLADMLEQVI